MYQDNDKLEFWPYILQISFDNVQFLPTETLSIYRFFEEQYWSNKSCILIVLKFDRNSSYFEIFDGLEIEQLTVE